MSDYTTSDAIAAAAGGNAHDFKKAVNDLLMDRVRDAVEMKKSEVASTFLSVEDEGGQESNVEGDDYEDQEI